MVKGLFPWVSPDDPPLPIDEDHGGEGLDVKGVLERARAIHRAQEDRVIDPQAAGLESHFLSRCRSDPARRRCRRS